MTSALLLGAVKNAKKAQSDFIPQRENILTKMHEKESRKWFRLGNGDKIADGDQIAKFVLFVIFSLAA